jgi:5-methylcytosine-specific restriction endonuclease McrA
MKKPDRELIRNKYNNKCAYCGCDLKKGWHVDHIEPVVRGIESKEFSKPQNHTIENMNPACASCNIQKNSYTLEQFRYNIKQFVNSLNQYSTQYKFARKYGLITETKIEVKFYFELLTNTEPTIK